MEEGDHAVFCAAACAKVGDVGKRVDSADLMEERLQILAVSCGVQFLQDERQRATAVHRIPASQTSRLRCPKRMTLAGAAERIVLICSVSACNLTIYMHGEVGRISGAIHATNEVHLDRVIGSSVTRPLPPWHLIAGGKLGVGTSTPRVSLSERSNLQIPLIYTQNLNT